MIALPCGGRSSFFKVMEGIFWEVFTPYYYRAWVRVIYRVDRVSVIIFLPACAPHPTFILLI